EAQRRGTRARVAVRDVADPGDGRKVAEEDGRRRLVERGDLDRRRELERGLRHDEPGVEEGRERDRGELQRPVVDDRSERPYNRGARTGAGPSASDRGARRPLRPTTRPRS